MQRLLFVGDPHAEPHDLKDCQALAGLIKKVAIDNQVDQIVLAGDLYHTHGVIHAEVQFFWWTFLQDLRNSNLDVLIIKGNHDAPGVAGTLATALLTHVEQATVVAWAPWIENGILFCPYTTGEQLVKWSNEHPECNTLICHATFDGSRYENGFYAGDGVNPNLIKQKRIISGHIHAPQEFGKVWYPGAPRWRILTDANTDRAIWVLDFDDSGDLQTMTPHTTNDTCRRIFHYVDTPTSSLPAHFVANDKDEFRIDIQGPQSWIDQRKPLFESWARIRALRTDSKVEATVKESDGVGVAFGKWMEAYTPRRGTDKTVLKTLVEERLHGW